MSLYVATPVELLTRSQKVRERFTKKKVMPSAEVEPSDEDEEEGAESENQSGIQ